MEQQQGSDTHDAYPERACVVGADVEDNQDLEGRNGGIGAWYSDTALYSKLTTGRSESERDRFLTCLREVDEDRDQVRLSVHPSIIHRVQPARRPNPWSSIYPDAPAKLYILRSYILFSPPRCTTLRQHIAAPTLCEYDTAEREVDAIRAE
ncbi:uncharacterized protein SCHCODRAFT_02662118 [Schizophyllum commune H4-8]|nr:uncharacterized protein SCHCODRAFT_02662118 [Schizophyllum commune H4-8]KAI5900626.1 hypothetical protein SCHCODRAFT_02662118 [Schizophyllum commune H4-8]